MQPPQQARHPALTPTSTPHASRQYRAPQPAATRSTRLHLDCEQIARRLLSREVHAAADTGDRGSGPQRAERGVRAGSSQVVCRRRAGSSATTARGGGETPEEAVEDAARFEAEAQPQPQRWRSSRAQSQAPRASRIRGTCEGVGPTDGAPSAGSASADCERSNRPSAAREPTSAPTVELIDALPCRGAVAHAKPSSDGWRGIELLEAVRPSERRRDCSEMVAERLSASTFSRTRLRAARAALRAPRSRARQRARRTALTTRSRSHAVPPNAQACDGATPSRRATPSLPTRARDVPNSTREPH
eukprot:7360173-Prymnesium_polylepis.1